MIIRGILVLPLMLGALAAAEPAVNPATDAQPRNTWLDLHEGQKKAARREAQVDLVLLGDSITAGWNAKDEPLWNERLKPLHACTLAIGGDRTENLLWRLRDGLVDGLRPRAAMLMIGTNNITRGDSGEQIAAGITAIVAELRTRLPGTRILLLGIFPSGEKAGNERRLKADAANTIIARLHDGKTVFYRDIGPLLTTGDGSITREVMSDFLHPTEKGRRIWFDAVMGQLAELMLP
ncbi:MAG: GDSL-type esterase/lipase family protein [Planctomycetes bacterium]|nr:GDSL-type esterase/lipase family protein [Planctomycetota bacterium]